MRYVIPTLAACFISFYMILNYTKQYETESDEYYISILFIILGSIFVFAFLSWLIPILVKWCIDMTTSIALLSRVCIKYITVVSKDKFNINGIEAASNALGTLKDIKEKIDANIDNRNAGLFAIAEEEYEKGEIDNGLWSKALVNAKGDESKRKVEYMMLRVKQLKKEA